MMFPSWVVNLVSTLMIGAAAIIALSLLVAVCVVCTVAYQSAMTRIESRRRHRLRVAQVETFSRLYGAALRNPPRSFRMMTDTDRR